MHSHLTLRLDRPLQQLLTMQTRGKLRRSLKKLASPRRAIPTLLVATLLGMYAIKVYIAMTFYDSHTEFPVEGLAPIGMLYILLLKLFGVCINRKKSGAGYRREEVHHLVGGPFRLEQVRLYRVMGHAISIFFTALFAAVFFVFHVKSFVAAVSGAYLAMLFTYLVYTVMAIVAFQVAEKTYRRLRMIGCGAAGAMMVWLIYCVSERGVSNLEFLQAFGDEAIQFSLLPGSIRCDVSVLCLHSSDRRGIHLRLAVLDRPACVGVELRRPAGTSVRRGAFRQPRRAGGRAS